MEYLHSELKSSVGAIRSRLRETSVNFFDLSIHITGRVNDDDTLISYTIHNDRWGGERVEVVGNNITVLIDEFIRRNGWQAAHAPKLLAAAE